MPIRSPAARRERARAEARQDILLAAAEVFARRGYAAATLAELAAAAGFAAPSLYRYFQSKDEIFRSIVELVRHEIGATFEAPVDRAAPLAARLEALLAAQYLLVESRRDAFAVLRDPVAATVVRMRDLGSLHPGFAFYEERLVEWLRQNASSAELRHPPEVAARAFAGVLFAFHPRDGESCGAERHRLVVQLALEGISTPAARRRPQE
jgi:AcrR family transcriptional regulator